jgi:hypothetical protein
LGGEANAGGDRGGVFVVAIKMVEESEVEKRRRKEKLGERKKSLNKIIKILF